jgi:hypothetical protein
MVELRNLNIAIKDSPLPARAINALTAAGYASLVECEALEEAGTGPFEFKEYKTAREIVWMMGRLKSSPRLSQEDQAEPENSHPSMSQVDVGPLSLLALPVNVLPLSVRALGILANLKVDSVLTLCRQEAEKLMQERNCGKKTVSEIESLLGEFALRLGMIFSPSLCGAVEEQPLRHIESAEQAIQELRQVAPDVADKLVSLRIRSIQASRIEFYTRCFQEYQRGGTLASAGKVLGLTRERVRQVLVKGAALGLFEYRPREYTIIPKEKLLGDYRLYPSSAAVAKRNGISTAYLKKLWTAYGITGKLLRKVAIEGKQEKCIEAYRSVESRLGHHPSTTELQREPSWRSLWARISRLWGSFEAFREQLNIPSPPVGSPTFREDTRKWREHQKRLALIIKMERLDEIRDCLSTGKPLSSSKISERCGMKYQRTVDLLKLLIATGEVRREGKGSKVKYRLMRKGGLE